MNGIYTWNNGTSGSNAMPALAGWSTAANASLFYDLDIGDTTTGNGCYASSNYNTAIIVDLGANPAQSIQGARINCVFYISPTPLYCSDTANGLDWQHVGDLTSNQLLTFGGPGYTKRYWGVNVQANGQSQNTQPAAGQSAIITDFRLLQYDGGYVQGVAAAAAAADFQLTPATQAVSLAAGASQTLNPDITVNPLNGQTGNVALSLLNVPAGLSAQLGTTSLAMGASTSLHLTNNGLAAGTYTFQVQGALGGNTHAQTITVTVPAPAAAVPAPAPIFATVLPGGIIQISGD